MSNKLKKLLELKDNFTEDSTEEILDGFFYFFGFTENPATKKVEDVLNKHIADKIKDDCRSVKNDITKQFSKFKNSICIE